MTRRTCRPVAMPLTVWERERQVDRMTELLERLADLLVQTTERWPGHTFRVVPAIRRLGARRDVAPYAAI